MASWREPLRFLILIVSLAVCLNIIAVKGEGKLACVVQNTDDKTLQVKLGCDSSEPRAVAWGKFRDEIHSTGWSFLEVHSNGSYPDMTQAVAVGMTEGFLTGELIYKAYQNTLAGYCDSEPEFCMKLGRFLAENEKWMMAQITSNPGDKYWYQVKLILAQSEGLKKGYAANASLPSILDFAFLLMQAALDIPALEQVLGKKNIHHMIGSGHCSALIKLLPGNKDLFISHVTWDSYSGMLRVFKLYDIPVSVSGDKGDIIAGRKQSFSSYPASMTSSDDFYMLSSGMVSQETTIGNSNPDLWKYVTETGIVLEWIRSIVANRLASTSGEWAYLFSKYNSGTYNNQWMVLDYKRFTTGENIKPGTLWILEQLPGIIESADMSVFLQESTYWASYNIPYFPYIYNISGTMASYKKFGAFFSYADCPRGQIFKRDHSKVVDMETMMKLMRYNDFKKDPLSRCNCTPPYSGENGISARSDLNPADGKYPISALGHRKSGGTDAKITNSKMMKELQCMAVSGPTHDQQPVFKWSTSGWKRPMGHPDAWNFEPLMVSWK